MSHEKNAEGFGFTRCKGTQLKKWQGQYGKEIRISRQDYVIEWCTYVKLENREVAGLCDSENQVLYVNVGVSNAIETMLHEIYHAEIAASGIRQRRDWCMNIEEQIVELLSLSTAHSFTLRKKKRV